MFIITFFKSLWNYKQFIVGAAMVLFFGLFLNQCKQTQSYKQKAAITQHIADQNIAALKDNTIQLMVTKGQLAIMDTNLSQALNKVDSIAHTKTKVITVAKPVYYGKDVIVHSDFQFDSLRNAYGLKFTSQDLVRTINGVSYFKLGKVNDSAIIPDSTKINDFKLNFTLVISQYDDKKNHYTRTNILPFNVKPDGSLGDPIPPSLLKVDFRNAEILDKPYTVNAPDLPAGTKKGWFTTGWGVSLNPVAVGMYPSGSGIKFGWTPNISLGYCITLRQK